MGLGAVLYWFALTPTHEGEWLALQARLPGVEAGQDTRGEIYRITNLRDFRYHPDGRIDAQHYREETYALADLRRVWLGISHFGDYGLAHTFLSFEFAGDNFLAASVEARLRPGQSYSPLFGLVRQYNKLIVLGSERDILGLRSHIRKERVLLYPLQLDEPQMSYLFRALMEDVQRIEARPDFYNTLLDNCTTNLLKYDPNYRFYTSLLDYRLLLPGYSDAVAYEKGWISTEQNLEDMRLRAVIDAARVDLQASDFSIQLRGNWRTGVQPNSELTSSEPNR